MRMKSILYYRNLSSTQCFYEGKGIFFPVYSVYRIAIDILCIDSLPLRKNKLLQSGAGGQDTALIQPHVPVSFGKLSLCG